MAEENFYKGEFDVGVPGQSLANLSQQSTMAQARKVNKKRKAPESVTPTIPRINVNFLIAPHFQVHSLQIYFQSLLFQRSQNSKI